MGLTVALVLALCLLLSVPVGLALGIAAFVGLLYSAPEALILMPQKFLAGLDSFPLMAIPLFVLAGSVMAQGGMARRIVDMAMVFVGRIPGGLGVVVILSAMLFSGISGSPSANTAAIGSVAFPAMKRARYPTNFATAILASAGGVSMLVPPAIDLIVIGVVTGMSIGALFAAGVLPALVMGLGIMALTYGYALKMQLPLQDRMPLKEKLRICWNGVLPVLMIVIILGGIYGGIFTPTEASAVAVVYGFCVSFFVYRELKLDDLPKVLLHTVSLTGIVMLVLATGSVVSFVLTFERIPHQIAEWITQMAPNWVIFILLVHVIFILLGMVMDALPAIIILMPILAPVAASLGMDPVHFGILVAANTGIGMITPPVGICLFVACGISRTPIEAVTPRLVPYLLVLAVTLMAITFFPEITLFLPRLLGYV